MVTLCTNPTREDAREIIYNLRKQEVKEYENLTQSPMFAALNSMKESRYCFCVKDDNQKPIALVGVADYPAISELKTGVVWLICSEDVRNSSLSFYKLLKDLLFSYGYMYDRLFNFVDVKAKNHQKFIESLGFVVTDDVVEVKEMNMSYTLFEMLTPAGLNRMYYLEDKQNG